MSSISPDFIVKYNHIPEVKRDLVNKSKLLVDSVLEEIRSNVQQAAPFKGITTVKINRSKDGGTIEVGPWWIGFIELGTVRRAAKPFLEPESNRDFATFGIKMKVIGETL